MNNDCPKDLPREKIKEVAKKVTEGFEFPNIPNVRDIAWAFPILYGGHTGELDEEFLNGQQCNAWRNITLLNSYRNAIDYSQQGKFTTLGRGIMAPPSHILFGDKIFDASHLHFPYAGRVNRQSIEDNNPKEIKRVSEGLEKSTYWQNLPEGFAEAVVKTNQLMHASDGKGGRLPKPFENEEALANYLSCVRDTLNQGAKYLNELKSRGRREEQVLTRARPEDFKNGDYLQMILFTKNGPVIYQAFTRGISDKHLGIDFWKRVYGKENPTLEECLNRTDWPLEKLKNAYLWRLEDESR